VVCDDTACKRFWIKKTRRGTKMNRFNEDNEKSKENPTAELAGKIILVRKSDKRGFAARLLGVRGDEIWLSNRHGIRVMLKRKVVEEITLIGGD
jgi:hypothetical protein